MWLDTLCLEHFTSFSYYYKKHMPLRAGDRTKLQFSWMATMNINHFVVKYVMASALQGGHNNKSQNSVCCHFLLCIFSLLVIVFPLNLLMLDGLYLDLVMLIPKYSTVLY